MSTWKIVRWDSRLKQGAIQGAHIGPLEFDEHATGVLDYNVGEGVNAKVDLDGGSGRVLQVEPLSARQPISTEAPELKIANGFVDYEVLSLQDGRLLIGCGGSIAYGFECVIEFNGVSYMQLPTGFSHALFRMASREEKEQVAGSNEFGNLFCIVTEHGDGDDGPRFFVAADSASARLEFVARKSSGLTPSL